MLPFGRRTPVRGGSDPTVESREPDQCDIAVVLLACQLADVELATGPHRRRPCVPHMRVVVPDDDPGVPRPAVEGVGGGLKPAGMWRSRRFHEDTSARYIWW